MTPGLQVALDRPVLLSKLPKEYRDVVRRCDRCFQDGRQFILCSDHRIEIRDDYPEEYA